MEIKAEASDDAAVIATAGNEEILEVLAVIPESDWTKVNKDGVEGYVKNQTVEVGVAYDSAVSMEEEAQREAEAARQQTTDTDAQHTTETEQTEAAEEQTETQEEQAEAQEELTETREEQTEAQEEPTEAQEEETQEVEEPSLYIEEVSETVWATDPVNVRGAADAFADRVGGLGKGESITRTGICENGWSRVDYNGTTAYIHSDYLTTTEPAEEEPVYNEPSSNSGLGQQIVDYARQFLGNPYVYGGTSLTNGTDCSGFVQSIYANFGYSLPRTCTTQSVCGRGVSVDELQPGDLVIYSSYGEIQHIAIYSGNGNTIHASNWDTGIIETSLSYSGDIYCCRRIVD